MEEVDEVVDKEVKVVEKEVLIEEEWYNDVGPKRMWM